MHIGISPTDSNLAGSGAAHASGSGSVVAWWSGKISGGTARAARNGGASMCCGSCIASERVCILAFPPQTAILAGSGAAHAPGSGSVVAWWPGKISGDTARAAGNGGAFMCHDATGVAILEPYSATNPPLTYSGGVPNQCLIRQ